MKTKILTFLANNWLTILLAIIPPIVIYQYLERDASQLDVILKTNTPVVQIAEQFSQGISVLYQSNRIASLNVLEIEVRNSGNRPIEASQFEEPLIFTFDGSVLPNPKVINVEPLALAPHLTSTSSNEFTLTRLLLNRGDRFSFLTYLIDSKTPATPLSIFARVTGVKDPRLINQAAYPNKKKANADILHILALVLGGLISAASATMLARRFKEITLDIGPGGGPNISVRFGDVRSAAQKLASDLNIRTHDFKSSILLLRIKLEDQLRELASRLALPADVKLRSPSQLSRRLSEMGILPQDIAAGIADVLPVINRELHATETYLSQNEWERLQQMSLELVAALMKLNADMIKQHK